MWDWMKKMKKIISISLIKNLVFYFFLVVLAISMLLPLIWMLNISLKPSGQIYEYPPSLIPKTFVVGNYVTAWVGADFSLYFKNTTIYTLVSVIFILFFSSLAGYTFARLRFPGRDILFLIILLTMMIPYQVTLIPLFLIVKNFPLAGGNNIFGTGGKGLIDTYAGLIIPGLVPAFGIFLFRQFFLGLPGELEDAARIDGCSEFRIYWQIMLPLTKPALILLGIFSFQGKWNDLLWPLIVTTTKHMRTLQIGLAVFQGEQRSGAQWNEMMAAGLVVIIPVIIIFLIGQKYFTKGVALTGIKG